MRPMGCCACLAIGIHNTRELELHHLLSGGHRISHFHTMFLCRGHHQGYWSSRQLLRLTPNQRISISSGRKAFAKMYGCEREMWEQLQARLGMECPWPSSKIIPRRLLVAVQ